MNASAVGSFDHLSSVRLETVELRRDEPWLRLHFSVAAPLVASPRPARFSDPLLPASPRFGGIYLALDFATCFVETMIRDKGDFRPDEYPLPIAELTARSVSVIRPTANLVLLSLDGDAPTRMRIPTDAAGAQDHTLGRSLSAALWRLHPDIDGILYPSRFTRRACAMIYDRATPSLRVEGTMPLVDHPDLDDVLDNYSIALTY